jgi:hypothetical protein
MKKLKKKTIEYVEWSDIEDRFQELALRKYGRRRKIRDWAGKFGGNETRDVPPQDFWHVMVDSEMVGDGKITAVNFDEWLEDMRNDPPSEEFLWQMEILELLAEVTDHEEVNIMFSW